MFSEPELDDDKLDKLDRKQLLERFVYFVLLCNKCATTLFYSSQLNWRKRKRTGLFIKEESCRLVHLWPSVSNVKFWNWLQKLFLQMNYK